jgi:hypothetical protein
MQTNQHVGLESGSFEIEVAGKDLKFRDAQVSDPVRSSKRRVGATR